MPFLNGVEVSEKDLVRLDRQVQEVEKHEGKDRAEEVRRSRPFTLGEPAFSSEKDAGQPVRQIVLSRDICDALRKARQREIDGDYPNEKECYYAILRDNVKDLSTPIKLGWMENGVFMPLVLPTEPSTCQPE